jgi:hypothetical protein
MTDVAENTLFRNSPQRHNRLAHPLLHQDEPDDEDEKADDSGDNLRRVPWPE